MVLGVAGMLLLAWEWPALRTAARSARIGPAAYARVTDGMSRDEVQSAIGLPPGDYRDPAHAPGGRCSTEWSEEAGQVDFVAGDTAGRLHWEGNAYGITAGFDEAGRVTWKTLWRHVPPTPRGPLGRLRAQLGL
jgi:hypothetical protein